MGSLATTVSSLDMEILEENLDGHKTSMTSLDPFENSCYEKNVSELSKVYSGSRPDLEGVNEEMITRTFSICRNNLGSSLEASN